MSETLVANSTISHYRILQKIGAGGMGDVYLAEDTELFRKAAIKILNERLGENGDYLRRFKQEARVVSALNHPNIITIYEVGESDDGRHFIAMEFIEGNNLRDLLRRGKIKLEEALEIAIQTAAALAAAHAAGIVHRDIKPENIMIRADGLVKVLDFGIAKLTAVPVNNSPIDTEATTRERISTMPGMIMGTVQYMSPEQIRGNKLDARTDIWSLGVLLYEMIAGKVPFAGETNSDVMAAILKTEPPTLSVYKPNIPLELEHIIKKALGKDCEERYQVVKDLLLDLKIFQSELNSEIKITASGSNSTTVLPGEKTNPEISARRGDFSGKHKWIWFGVPALILLLAGVFGFYWWRQNQESAANYPASLTASPVVSWKSELNAGTASRTRFSPDGKLVAYVVSKDGDTDIWLKQIGGGEPFVFKQENSMETSPLFSSDSAQIAYISQRDGKRGIWSAPALGGAPTLLAPLDAPARLVFWSKDGTTIFFDSKQNLYAFDLAGKQITQLTDFDLSLERGFSLSPDGQRIAYSDRKDRQRDIWIADKNGNNPVRITNDAAEDVFPVWHPDGKRIIYSSSRSGVKQICLGFSDARPPVQITFSDSDSEVADVSADGTKVLYQTTKDDSDIWGINLDDAKEFQLTSEIGAELWQTVAPNNETIAYQATRSPSVGAKLFNSLLFSQKIGDAKQPVQLAPDGFSPRWSPDGKHLAFLRFADGKINLWVVSAAGGDARALTNGGIIFGGFSFLPFNRFQTQDFQWSADGRSIIYCAKRSDIANVRQIEINGNERQLTNNEDKNLQFFNPVFSPDGKYLAWLSMATDNEKKTNWSVWISENGNSRRIYQSDSVLGLVGWSETGNELIIKTTAAAPVIPSEVNLSQLPLHGSALRPLAKLKAAFFLNIQLSPDRKTLAFVSRPDGKDSIQILNGGKEKKLAGSTDARVYFSSLAWSPDGKSVFFGKQANWQIISMIENFK